MNKPLRIGITGGIGSGKSLVCRVFETLGIPVYYSDDESKKLTDRDPQIIGQVSSLFGSHLYASGVLDRKALAALVFNDGARLDQLNAVIHPRVKEHFIAWCALQSKPYVIKEAAIMFESGAYKDLDYMVTVSAPQELRIKRVTERDGLSGEEIRKRMNNQLTDEEREKRSDFILQNDEKQLILPRIVDLHRIFLEKTDA